jgi:mannose-6-phosphate isomerase-like protein (cupin superfamily)
MSTNNIKSLSTKTAPHFVWGDNCDGWWLKKNGLFTVVSEIIPAGSSEIKHYHEKTEQFFYVLEGVLSVELDGITHHLEKDEGITVIPHAIHKVFNQSHNIKVKFLVISSPNSLEDRINVEK